MNRTGAALLIGVAAATLSATVAHAQVAEEGIAVRKDAMVGVAPGQIRVEDVAAGDVELVRTMTAGQILSHIMVADSLEVEIGRLGEQRIQNAELRTFASRIVTDHGNNLRSGWEVATNQNVALQRAQWDDSADHLTLALNRLRGMNAGPEFDRAFLREQILHHHLAAQRLRALRDAGTPETVRSYVDNSLTTIEDHLRMGQEIAGRMGMATIGPDGRILHDVQPGQLQPGQVQPGVQQLTPEQQPLDPQQPLDQQQPPLDQQQQQQQQPPYDQQQQPPPQQQQQPPPA